MSDSYSLNDLLREVDERETLANVRHYLLATLPKLERIAHMKAGQLKSPSMDGMPRSASSNNRVEDGQIKVLAAREALTNTVVAIKACSHDSQQILTNIYLRGKSDTPLRLELNLSRSVYFEYKRRALFEFADAFEGISDLHTYDDI